MTDDKEALNRWRLLLGKYAKEQISFSSEDVTYMEMEDVLDFLYSREYGEEQDVRGTKGGTGDSALTVPQWLHKMKKLFPKDTAEIMEHHALEKYNMTELLTDPEVLKSLEPNRELLKTVLELKHMMKGPVLNVAREVVRKVAAELSRQMEQDMQKVISGQLDKTSGSPIKSARNLDIRKTIRQNLKNYDTENEQLILKQVYFHSRKKRYNQWRVIVCVDESGSMLDSVIHSAVMAGIFAKLPMLDTKLVIFDTNVVDLSGYVEDPVETLMSIQLGGGTDIGGALRYCEDLIEYPYRTMVVLISDLYEGGSEAVFYRTAKNIIESGAKLIALTALDMEANPNYDKRTAQHLSDMGAHVGAMTPDHLVEFMAKLM